MQLIQERAVHQLGEKGCIVLPTSITTDILNTSIPMTKQTSRFLKTKKILEHQVVIAPVQLNNKYILIVYYTEVNRVRLLKTEEDEMAAEATSAILMTIYKHSKISQAALQVHETNVMKKDKNTYAKPQDSGLIMCRFAEEYMRPDTNCDFNPFCYDFLRLKMILECYRGEILDFTSLKVGQDELTQELKAWWMCYAGSKGLTAEDGRQNNREIVVGKTKDEIMAINGSTRRSVERTSFCDVDDEHFINTKSSKFRVDLCYCEPHT